MICPACGEQNRDDADFCALCLKKLPKPALGTPRPGEGSRYAPGEWHGELAASQPVMREEVAAEVRRFRVKHLGFFILVATIVILFALLVTVWGAKTPADITRDFMESTAAGDSERALALVYPGTESTRQEFYGEWSRRLEGATFKDLKIEVERTDQDIAVARITGGSVSSSSGTKAIGAEDGLRAELRMQKGRWYVYPADADFLP